MDNHKDFATRAHDMGWRAYRQYDGLFIQRHDGSGFYVVDRVSIKDWHALRAYQDAERKKGVPISFGNDLNPYEWFRRNYGGFNFTSGDGTRGMPPMIFSKAAKFTNFRWRAGYPKKGIGGIVKRIEDAQL